MIKILILGLILFLQGCPDRDDMHPPQHHTCTEKHK